jgi:hypothetical protein
LEGRGSLPGRRREFSLLHSLQIGSETHSAPIQWVQCLTGSSGLELWNFRRGHGFWGPDIEENNEKNGENSILRCFKFVFPTKYY